jgi:hypothetical protein
MKGIVTIHTAANTTRSNNQALMFLFHLGLILCSMLLIAIWCIIFAITRWRKAVELYFRFE